MNRSNRGRYGLVSLTVLIALASSALGGPPPEGSTPILNPANGHYYLAVAAPGTSWTAAFEAASQMRFGAARGHLLTITSAEESAFISKNFSAAADAEYLIGGIQDDDGEEPAGRWTWVTGEPFSFTNWIPGEPNDIDGGEDYLQLKTGARWNDTRDLPVFAGYLVEFEPSPVQLTDFSVRKAKVKGSKSIKATLTLAAAPEEEGLQVSLSSDSPLFKGPASVDLKAGSTRTKIALKTRKTRKSTVITITAEFGGVIKDLQLKVLK